MSKAGMLPKPLVLSLVSCLLLNFCLAEEKDQPPSEERVALFREAAQAGHVDSMWAMGTIYRDGWGAEKDSVQAVLWFNLAAREGDGSSAFYLSQMHFNGEGIEKDRVAARVWAIVAFAKHIEGAEQILTKLKEELTEEQMEQSVQILGEIIKKHPNMLGG
ncbi:sel1 repeat family protein [Opitutia bacterium ISCC 51]|nr:sel1 repeat family protein [Opitutae bacterium ISCC 51]QXD29442.1 sel1 repeat family protein [Opitutae bacterium ISCC 52]